MFSTALLYHRGEAVPKDMAEAARWYRKAADLGHLVSMRSLADLYQDGEGVPKDANEALRWRRAAKASASPPGSTPLEAKAALVKELPLMEYEPVSLAFAPDGTRILALASGGYFAWLDPNSSSEPAKFGQGSCCQVVISPNGRLAATGNYDEKAARLWNLETGEIAKDLEGHSEYVVAVSFSSDGKLLASGSYDTTGRMGRISSPATLTAASGSGTWRKASSCKSSKLTSSLSIRSPFRPTEVLLPRQATTKR